MNDTRLEQPIGQNGNNSSINTPIVEMYQMFYQEAATLKFRVSTSFETLS